MRIVTGLLILTLTTSAHADEPKQIKPLIEMTFSVGKEVKGCLERCDTREQWGKVWNRFQPKEYLDQKQALPKIDFKTHMVVVICHEGTASGTPIFGIIDKPECVCVRYRAGGTQFRNDPFATKEQQKKLTDSLMHGYTYRLTSLILQSIEKPIVFEEGFGVFIEPSEWKERARLEKKAK